MQLVEATKKNPAIVSLTVQERKKNALQSLAALAHSLALDESREIKVETSEQTANGKSRAFVNKHNHRISMSSPESGAEQQHNSEPAKSLCSLNVCLISQLKRLNLKTETR